MRKYKYYREYEIDKYKEAYLNNLFDIVEVNLNLNDYIKYVFHVNHELVEDFTIYKQQYIEDKMRFEKIRLNRIIEENKHKFSDSEKRRL